MVRRGAALSQPDAESASPLDVAILTEATEAVQALREHGAASTYYREGHSLTHHLAAHGRAAALALCFPTASAKSATVPASVSDALHVPNEAGLEALHLAAQHGHADAVQVLLCARADPARAAPDGIGAPLHVACRRGDAAVAEVLIGHGAPIGAKSGVEARTPLHLAAAFPACTTLLLSAGATAEERDASGCTALHYAASLAPVAALQPSCRALLDGGARPNVCEFVHKQTALHRLCERGGGSEALGTMRLLLTHGATINAQVHARCVFGLGIPPPAAARARPRCE